MKIADVSASCVALIVIEIWRDIWISIYSAQLRVVAVDLLGQQNCNCVTVCAFNQKQAKIDRQREQTVSGQQQQQITKIIRFFK